MKTFKKVSKARFAKAIQHHVDMDKIIQGTYGSTGEGFKGCMMGCVANSLLDLNVADDINSDNHKEQAELLGLPLWFVYLYESIFEGLSVADSKQWVIDCFNAIPEGIDTALIDELEIPIKIWIIESTYKHHDNKEVLQTCKRVVKALKSGSSDELVAAGSSARSAGSAAALAAALAASAGSAESARSAADSAWSAVRLIARSTAGLVAHSVELAANSAEHSAWLTAHSVEDSVELAACSAGGVDAYQTFYKSLREYVLNELSKLSINKTKENK